MEVFCFVITIRNSDMDMFFHCICNCKVRLLSNPKPCGGKFIEIAWKFMPCDCCSVFFHLMLKNLTINILVFLSIISIIFLIIQMLDLEIVVNRQWITVGHACTTEMKGTEVCTFICPM